jgi:EmrB/QacA subfamily drug resistance transporter
MTPPGSRPVTSVPDRRWQALVVLCVGMLMIVLDQTIVNVALPSIQSDLGFSPSSLAWVVNAYLVAFGGLLLLAGRLGDLVGRKRVFMAGLAAFTAASLLCGLSTSPQLLVAARFAQGAGGALSSAVILGMIVTMFPGQPEQARAIGMFSFVASAGASIGLLAGGVLTQTVSWHWIFFVNVPIGIAALALAARLIEPDAGSGLGEGADAAGALLVTSSLMLGVYTIVETTRYGWTSARTLGLGGLAIALLAGFIARQATAASPLLPLRLFRTRSVWGANAVQVLMVAGLFGFFFLTTLDLRLVLGLGPLAIGLAFLPVAVAIGLLSFDLAPRLVGRFGARSVLLVGLALTAGALALVTRVPVHSAYAVDLLPGFLMIGVGAGLSFPALMTLGMSRVAPDDAGLASGLISTSAQVGAALGLAALATAAASRTAALRAAGEAPAAALTGGYRLVFGIGAGLLLTAILLAALALRGEGAAGRVRAEYEADAEDHAEPGFTVRADRGGCAASDR